MAYIPSECTLEQYEEQIYSGYSKHRLYIKHGNTEIGEEANDYASPYASSFSWNRRILKKGSKTFSLNNFVSQEIELTMHNYLINDLNEELTIRIDTYIEELSKYAKIPLGIYKIESVNTNDKGESVYKLRDKSVNFDFKYNAKDIIDTSSKINDEGNQYVTKLEILLDICNKANVAFASSQEFIGNNDPIGIYDSEVTGRTYIADIAEQAGCIATIDRNGELIFIEINNNLLKRSISEDYVETIKQGDNFEISKVVYELGTITFQNGTEDKDTLFINGSNPYIANQEQLDRIFSNINGFKINSFTTGKILGNPTFDPYDLISITYNGNTFYTFAQYDLSFTGTIIMNFDTTIEHSAKQINSTNKGDKVYQKIVKQEIDNVKGEIKTVAKSVETVSDDTANLSITVNNNYNDVLEKMGNYTPMSIAKEIEKSVETLQSNTYTKTQIQEIVRGNAEDGTEVSYVKNKMVTIDMDGQTIDSDNSKVKTNMNVDGFKIIDKTSGEDILFKAVYNEESGKTEVGAGNIAVEHYFMLGTHSRFEDYENGTGCFYIR